MKRSCHPNLTDGKFAKSNPFHFKTSRKRLIFNYFKELLTRFNGTAMYSNIDYTQVLPSFIANKKENPDCFHLANRLGLFLLLAYDEQKDKDERLINTALDLFEWLRKEDIDELSNLSSKINILQIKKRLNLLNDEEKDELYDIAENVVSDDARFAAHLLLDEQKHALRYFNRLDANQQEFYRTLPIFHFIDNNAR